MSFQLFIKEPHIFVCALLLLTTSGVLQSLIHLLHPGIALEFVCLLLLGGLLLLCQLNDVVVQFGLELI